MWAELRKTYETTEEDNAYFDNYKYLARVRRKHPDWKWPGKNSGRWLPPLTQPPDEIIPELEPGTKFTVTNILYQAVSRGMKYQAVEALIDNSDYRYDQSKVDKTGFIWIWHKDKKYFKEVEKKKEGVKEEETEWIRHDIKDEEFVKGFTPDWQKKYELVFTSVIIRMDKRDQYINDQDKFILTGKDKSDNVVYKKMLIVSDEKRDDKPVIEMRFQATPGNIKYTLECDPGTPADDEGNERSSHIIFENRPYSELGVKR